MIIFFVAEEDPCSPGVYNVFDSTTIHQRSSGYTAPADSNSLICDIQIDHTVWHRFISPAGNEMPTTCPPQFACGKIFSSERIKISIEILMGVENLLFLAEKSHWGWFWSAITIIFQRR